MKTANHSNPMTYLQRQSTAALTQFAYTKEVE